MRGGAIYVQGNAGYRAGVHMKAYGDRLPMIVIGGRAGSFLGEYRPAVWLWCWGSMPGNNPLLGISPVPGCTAARCFSALTAGMCAFRTR